MFETSGEIVVDGEEVTPHTFSSEPPHLAQIYVRDTMNFTYLRQVT